MSLLNMNRKAKREGGGGGQSCGLTVSCTAILLLAAASTLRNNSSSLAALLPTTQSISSSISISSSGIINPLGIPVGQAINLPSVRGVDVVDKKRSIYGGKGDQKHLGGFTELD